MEKQKALIVSACISILIASGVIGFCVIYGSKIIANTIREKKMAISGDLRSRLNEAGMANLPMPEANKMPQLGSQRVLGVSAGHNVVKGNNNAKVLMVEFSDFQCPFSKSFYQMAFPQIEKEYISTGKVKFAYRNFPLAFHPQAVPAAIACECAGKQGKYWQMFDKIISSDSLEIASLKNHAKEIGLDRKTFDACLDGQKTKDLIDEDTKEAARLGVQGTPAFFINGRLVTGALPFEEFKKVIDEELSK